MRPLPIFIHIPRTGGRTFNKMADRNVTRTLGIYGSGIVKARKVIKDKMKKAPELIRGHMSFGCHEVISQECEYLTILREPVSRVLSLYKHIKRSPKHFLYAHVKGMSIKTFVTSGITCEANNGQVRQLSGLDGELTQKPWVAALTPYGECSQSLLAAVMSNIRNHFLIVGVTDEYDAFVQAVGRLLGWSDLSYERLNKTAPRPRVADLTKGTIQEICRRNVLDIELYMMVREHDLRLRRRPRP